MNKFPTLLLALLLIASAALAQTGKHAAAGAAKKKKTFNHTAESSKGRTSKAKFREDTHPPTVNLHPKDPTRFTKVRANKNLKYSKAK